MSYGKGIETSSTTPFSQMGRAIYIYHFQKEKFAKNIAHLPTCNSEISLTTWLDTEPVEGIIEEIQTGVIRPRSLSLIITWAWNNQKEEQLLHDLGIDPFMEITTTFASCTFMEEWYNFSEKEDPNVDFFISGSALSLFLEWLVFLSDVFHQRKTTTKNKKWRDRAEAIWWREKSKKEQSGDHYSGKWKLDYFNFLEFDFQPYLDTINSDHSYFIIDSQ